MASQFDSWESYFYPDTIDPDTGIGTLRNLYEERDARVLSRMEYTDTTVRAVQLGNGEVEIAHRYRSTSPDLTSPNPRPGPFDISTVRYSPRPLVDVLEQVPVDRA